MPIIELENEELQVIMDNIATTMTWAKANPLLVKISQQIQAQQQTMTPAGADGSLQRTQGDGAADGQSQPS